MSKLRSALPAARIGVRLAALALAGLAAGCSASGQPFDLMDLTGAELFDRFCAACHGPEGRGDGPVAPSLSTVVPDLTRIAERNGGEFPAEVIRDTIDGRALVVSHGPRTMPVWGYEFWLEEGADITAEREARALVRRLVEHLASIQR